jgi:hypothetical protein
VCFALSLFLPLSLSLALSLSLCGVAVTGHPTPRPLPNEEGASWNFAWKPRPDSGLDCLMCSKFSGGRQGYLSCKDLPPPHDHRRAYRRVLGGGVLMSDSGRLLRAPFFQRHAESLAP